MPDNEGKRTLKLKLALGNANQDTITKIIETVFAHAPMTDEYIDEITTESDARTNAVTFTVTLKRALTGTTRNVG